MHPIEFGACKADALLFSGSIRTRNTRCYIAVVNLRPLSKDPGKISRLRFAVTYYPIRRRFFLVIHADSQTICYNEKPVSARDLIPLRVGDMIRCEDVCMLVL